MNAEVDLAIIGGGPAGCAAAVMAASVGMTTILVDPAGRPGGSLWRIPAIDNVLGGHRTGPALARVIAADLERSQIEQVRARAARVHADRDDVTVALGDGGTIRSAHCVMATGVRSAQPDDAPWITAPPGLRLPPLWEMEPEPGSTWLVLGADRPLGTFLRAHPDLDITLHVVHPPSDDYKADEVRHDLRIHLTRTETCNLSDLQTSQVDVVVGNIGVVPAALDGLAAGSDGYCPPESQHPRLHIAGDLRSARGQRVQTAMGTGADAALRAYYLTRG